MAPSCHTAFPVRDYDLAATLTSGQAFRWRYTNGGWHGVIGRRWVRLVGAEFSINAWTAEPISDWAWLQDYLQTKLNLSGVLASFPDDPPLRCAAKACHGLRLLRQPPWECLASFILSSTKQIVQIRQIIDLLCQSFGDDLHAGDGYGPACSFPTPERLAQATESQLRRCKMGFRAPYLLAAARRVAAGEMDLRRLPQWPIERARSELMNLPGVGRKIADCVLLFAYGFQEAFPVDVWVMKALRTLYFPKRRATPRRLQEFCATHFGVNAGYAQQYLFHYMRTKEGSGRTAA